MRLTFHSSVALVALMTLPMNSKSLHLGSIGAVTSHYDAIEKSSMLGQVESEGVTIDTMFTADTEHDELS